jgi:hypothetical protein
LSFKMRQLTKKKKENLPNDSMFIFKLVFNGHRWEEGKIII